MIYFARMFVVGVFVVFVSTVSAAEIAVRNDAESGMELFELVAGKTRVLVAPAAGANAYSIQIDGNEQFRQPDSLKKLAGAGFGNPILYPTPNRVRDAEFLFRDKRVRFKANSGKNFIHGLVNRRVWKVVDRSESSDAAEITCEISFAAGTELHKLFPFSHTLRVKIRVLEGVVRWEYEVTADGSDDVPFGFALHPYFLYRGDRKNCFLTIPATHMMESQNRLPTGKLLGGDDLDFALGQPMTMAGKTFDDVFLGMTDAKPTIIEHRDRGETIRIAASNDFTHLVVWTPDRPYFGVESQTCSTDAHNMHANGHREVAHLQVCPAGAKRSGWVEYRFQMNR